MYAEGLRLCKYRYTVEQIKKSEQAYLRIVTKIHPHKISTDYKYNLFLKAQLFFQSVGLLRITNVN